MKLRVRVTTVAGQGGERRGSPQARMPGDLTAEALKSDTVRAEKPSAGPLYALRRLKRGGVAWEHWDVLLRTVL